MLKNLDGKDVILPDFLIVGAARSGTTYLYNVIKQHPMIFMPTVKEPFFFSFINRPPDYEDPDFKKFIIWELDKYLSLFEKAKFGQVIGEASTSYLYTYKNTICHIKSLYGNQYRDLKIVTILRNPVDRAFSHYLFLIKNGVERLSFEEAIDPRAIKNRKKSRWGYDYTGYGMYYEQVKAYLNEFLNVKVYLYEDLKNPKNLVKNLFDFLGVDPAFEVDIDMKSNPSGIPKNRFLFALLSKEKNIGKRLVKIFIPQRYKLKVVNWKEIMMEKLLKRPLLSAELRKKLLYVFREDILKLETLINRDLSHWLEV